MPLNRSFEPFHQINSVMWGSLEAQKQRKQSTILTILQINLFTFQRDTSQRETSYAKFEIHVIINLQFCKVPILMKMNLQVLVHAHIYWHGSNLLSRLKGPGLSLHPKWKVLKKKVKFQWSCIRRWGSMTLDQCLYVPVYNGSHNADSSLIFNAKSRVIKVYKLSSKLD